MRVLHDGQGLLAGRAAAEAVDEIGQAVFVQAARQHQANGQRQDPVDGQGKDVAAEPEGKGHQAAGEPADQGPARYHTLEVLGRHINQPPERQPREKNQGGQ